MLGPILSQQPAGNRTRSDSSYLDAVGQFSQIQSQPQLVAVESGGLFALESVYLLGLVGLAEPAGRHPAP